MLIHPALALALATSIAKTSQPPRPGVPRG
jgi:hypothetical protein